MKKIAVLVAIVVVIVCAVGGWFFWRFVMSDQAKVTHHVQEIKKIWLNNNVFLDGILESNRQFASLGDADMRALDKEWQEEGTSGKYNLIDKVASNNVSKYIQGILARSNGLYSEIIVMNNKGMTVGAYPITSDYWQGDEAKWQKTFLKGNGAVFIDKAKFDDSIEGYQSQVSFTVTNPADGKPIGAISVGINLTKLK